MKMKNIALLSILMLLLIVIPASSAVDNNDGNNTLENIEDNVLNDEYYFHSNSDNDGNNALENIEDNVLNDEYYFDSNSDNDGNGSIYNPYKTLSNEKIIDNSIIHLANGEYNFPSSKSFSNISFYGEDTKNTILNGNGKRLNINGLLTLNNITLKNFSINNIGSITAINVIFENLAPISTSKENNVFPGIYNIGGKIYFDNCSFYNNDVAKYGGVIYSQNGYLTILNSIFENNTASGFGGAIALNSNNVLIINKTKFINCKSINNAGGAIYIKKSDLTANSLYIADSYGTFGGAITALNSNLKFNNLTAFNNSAKYNGGAIYTMYGSISLNNSIFNMNVAENGGGLFIDNSDYDLIVNTVFSNNKANMFAGAIYSLLNSNSKLYENNFINNEALNFNDIYNDSLANIFIGNGDYNIYNYNSSQLLELPNRYSSVEEGYVTSVKDQLSGNTCWAFAAIATLESCILKASGDNLDLSEENLANLMQIYSDYGWNYESKDEGGLIGMGIGYLVSWLGPIYDVNDIYDSKSVLSPVLNSIMHVQNVKFFKRNNYTDNDDIKRAILDYGAVSTSLYMMGVKEQYCSGSEKPNHAVVIVGWDDNKVIPNAPGRGAWIIKNSWGDYWGNDGYFYVSYYDTSCAQIGRSDVAYSFILNDSFKFDKNYQYDIPGKTDFFFNKSSTVWYKNIFTATDNEYLTAVSTYFDKFTNYEFSIYVNNTLKLIQSGVSGIGYYTFNLNKFIPLNIGDKFEVIFKITVDGDAGFPISEKVSLVELFYNQNISFLSYDGENWVDLYNLTWVYSSHTYNSQVACIKAFTILNPIATSIKLDIENIENNTCDIIATVYNEWGYIVDMGNVTFNINNTNFTVDITNGVARLTNVSLDYGLNKFLAQFNCLGYNTSNNFIMVSISKMNTTMNLSVISNSNPIEIQAIVKDDNNDFVESGYVVFNVEGANYTVEVVDGKATLVHMFNKSGSANITAYYLENYAYNPSNCSISYYVPIIYTNINLTILNNQNIINITALVTDSEGNLINEGNVTFKFDGKTMTFSVLNGIVSFDYIFEKEGTYDIFAEFNAINNFNSSKNSSSINISLINTHLVLEVNPNCHNPVEIIARVYDGENNLVNSGIVTFTIENKDYNVNVVEGIAKITHIFKNMGDNQVSANYNKNYLYNSSNDSEILNVSKIKVELSLSILKDLNNVTVIVTHSVPMNGEYVSISINDKFYSTKIQDSKATFIFNNLSVGNYTVKSSFNSDVYDASNVNGSFIIYNYQTILEVVGNEFYYGDSIFKVILKSTAGDLIKNREVMLEIGEETYRNITDELGAALFLINLNFNDTDFKIYYDGDEDFNKSYLNGNIHVYSTVISQDATKTYNSNYEFKLLDSYGNPLKNTDVKVTVDSQVYNIKTNENGIAKLPINLNQGNYNISITNPSNGDVKTQKISVVNRIAENKAITMYYGAGKYYVVKVYDDDGNPATGVNVAFKINGKTYTRTTDTNGYASIKITLNPGTYTISAEYKGFRVSNKVTVKSTIITKNVNVKKGKAIKFTVKLLNKNGKILKNKKVTIKFKGKTYKVKTNKKGNAILKITKRYKVGKYTITTKYGKLSVKNTIRIKR